MNKVWEFLKDPKNIISSIALTAILAGWIGGVFDPLVVSEEELGLELKDVGVQTLKLIIYKQIKDAESEIGFIDDMDNPTPSDLKRKKRLQRNLKTYQEELNDKVQER